MSAKVKIKKVKSKFFTRTWKNLADSDDLYVGF